MLDGSRPIRVRKLDFDFRSVPRRWFFDSTFASHLANGVNMLFPEGERFFIRAVKHYLAEIEGDPELLARVRGFFGQEGSHGHAHEKAFEILRAQGYEIDQWLRWYEKAAYRGLAPRFSPVMRLSITVALEHFTATMAEHALATDMLDHAHPVMQRLLRWHASEEIEHKSVAFDVLRRVDPRYSVRVGGLFFATIALLGFWRLATRMLVRQDIAAGRTTRADLVRERKDARARGQDFAFVRRSILEYLRPSFHPDDRDNYALARDWLSAQGRLQG